MVNAYPRYPTVIDNRINFFADRNDISNNFVSVIISVNAVNNVVDNIYGGINTNSSVTDVSVYTASQAATVYAVNNVIDNTNVVTGTIYIINSTYNTYKSVIVCVNNITIVTTVNATCDYVVVNGNESVNISQAADWAVSYLVKSVHNVIVIGNANAFINVFNYEHFYKSAYNSVINSDSLGLIQINT